MKDEHVQQLRDDIVELQSHLNAANRKLEAANSTIKRMEEVGDEAVEERDRLRAILDRKPDPMDIAKDQKYHDDHDAEMKMERELAGDDEL